MTAAEQELFEHEIIGTTYEALYKTGLFTGMRLGELLGLTWNDVDFSKNSISVNKALAYIQEKDGEHGVIKLQTPKTSSSIRTIPMTSELSKLLKIHKLKQNTLRTDMEGLWVPYEGMEDLVFTGCYGRPITRGYLRKNLDLIVKRINEKELVLAKEEGREAVIFKKITPHTLRHTYATNFDRVLYRTS